MKREIYRVLSWGNTISAARKGVLGVRLISMVLFRLLGAVVRALYRR